VSPVCTDCAPHPASSMSRSKSSVFIATIKYRVVEP
jgi:hypothetical protein